MKDGVVHVWLNASHENKEIMQKEDNKLQKNNNNKVREENQENKQGFLLFYFF